MKDFFEAIASLFQDYLFIPFNILRQDIQPESWIAANGLNIVFILIGVVLFAYWMKQLKSYDEDTSEKNENFLI
jgi:cytochrome c oxidase assembly factor CtaG